MLLHPYRAAAPRPPPFAGAGSGAAAQKAQKHGAARRRARPRVWPPPHLCGRPAAPPARARGALPSAGHSGIPIRGAAETPPGRFVILRPKPSSAQPRPPPPPPRTTHARQHKAATPSPGPGLWPPPRGALARARARRGAGPARPRPASLQNPRRPLPLGPCPPRPALCPRPARRRGNPPCRRRPDGRAPAQGAAPRERFCTLNGVPRPAAHAAAARAAPRGGAPLNPVGSPRRAGGPYNH